MRATRRLLCIATAIAATYAGQRCLESGNVWLGLTFAAVAVFNLAVLIIDI